MADPTSTPAVDPSPAAAPAPAPTSAPAPAAAEPTAPAAAAPDTRSTLERMSFVERQEYQRTGKIPDHITGKKAPEPTGDDAPAVDAQGQAVRDAQGKPLSRRQVENNRRIQDAIDRGLATERSAREAAERRAAELEAQLRGTPPEPKPQAAAGAAPAADAEPSLNDFLDQDDPYLAYSRALARWEVRQELQTRDQAQQQQTAAERAHAAVLNRVAAHNAREEAIRAAVPDYDAKTLPLRQQLNMDSPLTLAVVESDVSEKILLHFAEHPDDFDRIGRLGMVNLPAALREIGKLEARVSSTAPPAASAPAAPKQVTSAPPLGTTLGSRPAAAANEDHSAVARGDVSAFMRQRNSLDVEARRSGIR